VRRDAHRELEFRYDQEERLSRGTAPPEKGPPDPFSGADLPVLLMNVALLAVALVASAWASGGSRPDRTLQARLQAMPFESTFT
jgi:hypothetical protein